MISIIAAVGKNLELGKENKLIWHLKSDLKNFKDLTMNKKIVMGKNTYLSLPKRLEGREYIILSNSLKDIENAHIFNDFETLLKYLQNLEEEVMIIGGASIYKLFLPYAYRLYLTEVDEDANADAYFPSFDTKDYKIIEEKAMQEDNLKYKFVIYEKR